MWGCITKNTKALNIPSVYVAKIVELFYLTVNTRISENLRGKLLAIETWRFMKALAGWPSDVETSDSLTIE